jgi:DNA repair protein RadA/Sms
MSKVKTKFICSECGFESIKWAGKCPSCDSWNSFSEEIIETGRNAPKKFNGEIKISKLSFHPEKEDVRIKSGIEEFDRVLGGGIIPGSVVLIGGDPGIGKSTLVLQAAAKIPKKVLYVSGEESYNQIALRAKRLNAKSDTISIVTETNLNLILSAIQQTEAEIVVIDSIQTLYNPDFENTPGTVTQIRECTAVLMQVAKTTHCAIIIVGHITKEGIIAGPKILEHMVDAVIQFEGERTSAYRILRGQKNRFGSTNEIGIFEMQEDGLHEVANPSEIFLGDRDKNVSGSVVTASIEGSRAVLFEVQALVTPSNFGNPQRVATGFDYRRLSILLAVLEKRAGLRLSSFNVFLNMAGGLKIDDPAVDLAVCCAIASSYKDKPVQKDLVVIGEVGLGGEIRSIGHIDKRIMESQKLGFSNIIISANNAKRNKNSSIKVVEMKDILSVINFILQ